MGDRGNIVVRATQNPIDDVWFYTHWSGSNIEEIAQRALAKRWRWGDTSYLARIVFDELTADQHGGETGFGISTSLGDNEHEILVIDDDRQQVYTIREKELVNHRIPEGYNPVNPKSYQTFIESVLVT